MKFSTTFLHPEVILQRPQETASNPDEKTGDNLPNVLEKTWTGEAAVASESQHAAIDSEVISPEAQHGVQKIEATTSAWTFRDLVVAYIL